jgi:hypothetical protein
LKTLSSNDEIVGAAMQEIVDWLKRLGMSKYSEKFAENDIDIDVLPELTDQARRLARSSAQNGASDPRSRQRSSCRYVIFGTRGDRANSA